MSESSANSKKTESSQEAALKAEIERLKAENASLKKKDDERKEDENRNREAMRREWELLRDEADNMENLKKEAIEEEEAARQRRDVADFNAQQALFEQKFATEDYEQAKDRTIALTEAQIKAARAVDDHPFSAEVKYTRKCAICLVENPRFRCTGSCGHIFCQPCIDEQHLTEDTTDYVTCALCREVVQFTRSYETEEGMEEKRGRKRRAEEVNEAMEAKANQCLDELEQQLDECPFDDLPVRLPSILSIIFSTAVLTFDRTNTTAPVCASCCTNFPSMLDAFRHMMAHCRVIRLSCGLCGAGAFHQIDLRNHLQQRGCSELGQAPANFIRSGTPCMTEEHADNLIFVAHSADPGSAVLTTGPIVSVVCNTPYFPDPAFEQTILGSERVPDLNLSTQSVLKVTEKGLVSIAVMRFWDQMPGLKTIPATSGLAIEHGDIKFYIDGQDENDSSDIGRAMDERFDDYFRGIMTGSIRIRRSEMPTVASSRLRREEDAVGSIATTSSMPADEGRVIVDVDSEDSDPILHFDLPVGACVEIE